MTQPGIEANDEDELVRDWRRRAADTVLTAAAVVHFPAVILMLEGQAGVVGAPLKAAIVAGFAVNVAGAAFRRVDYRIRVWTQLTAIWAISVIGIATTPDGPYFRSLAIVAPMLAIGLIGVRPAWAAALVSAVVLVLAPLLHAVPGVGRLLRFDPRPVAAPSGTLLLPGLALTAELVVLMILLGRLYDFLLKTLAAERAATAAQAVAGRKLERDAEEKLRLEREIARVGDDERRRLGDEIHDGVCQQLTGALLRCQALELHLERGVPMSAADLAPLSSLLSETINEARAVALGLMPLEATSDALSPALRILARRTQHLSGVPCAFHASGDVKVQDPTTAQHLYRIAQEAMSNAARHARANRITVELRGSDDALSLQVADDGVGLPDTVPPGGMGLHTMAFRAEILGGEFAVERAPGGGTRASCRVPRSPHVPPGVPGRAIPEGPAT